MTLNASWRPGWLRVKPTYAAQGNMGLGWYQTSSTNGKKAARVGRPQTSSSPPVIFTAGCPKAALLFWFFGDFRCGALLFMVIHVIYKYKNR